MNAWRKVLVVTLAALMIGSGLSACSESDNNKPVRIGTNVWPGYEPLYLARDTGLYDKTKVQLVEYPSASGVIRALKSRSIEAAALTLDEVLVLLQHDIPLHAVLVLDISHGGDVIIAKPNFPDFKQLRGKRVGVEGSALGAYVLSRALDINAMSIDDITIVQLEADEHERSYTEDMVDAVVTFEPTRTNLLNQGGMEVFTSREIPGEIVDVLVVHADAITQSPNNIRHIVDGWFKALDKLKNDPQASGAIIAQRLGISPDEALASFEGLHLPDRAENKMLLSGPGAQLAPVMDMLSQTMRTRDLLQGDVDTRTLLDPFALTE